MTAFATFYLLKCLGAVISGWVVGATHRTVYRGLNESAR